MKKINTKGTVSIVIGILFVIYSLIAFGVIGYNGKQFATAYLFTAFAYVLFTMSIWLIYNFFLNYPILIGGVLYVVVQTIISIVFMRLPWDAFKASVIVQLLVAAAYGVAALSVMSAKNVVSGMDDKTRKKRNYLELLQMEIETLLLQDKSSEVEKALTDLSETIRYSDPMSAKELAAAEDEILEKVTLLGAEYPTLSEEEQLLQIKEIKNKMLVRNRKCKVLK